MSALKTLTSIIHLERTTKYVFQMNILFEIEFFSLLRHPPCLQEIIETTQINSYYGFLPSLVRQCINKLTGQEFSPFCIHP